MLTLAADCEAVRRGPAMRSMNDIAAGVVARLRSEP
jgi:hypothetical protein